MSGRDEKYMRLAIAQAKKAALAGDVPVGAVCVLGDEVISVGRNRREFAGNALAHAELEAIELACRRLGGWRLWECELFVTLEPCPMCAGAAVNARLKRVVYGASDPVSTICGEDSIERTTSNKKPQTAGGVLEDECAALLKNFFSETRQKLPKRAASAERITLGDVDPSCCDSFEQEYAALVKRDGRFLFSVTDGKYSFPKTVSGGRSPAAAFSQDMPRLSIVGKRLTAVKRGGGTIVDRIYYSCELEGEPPEGYVFSDKPAGLDEQDETAFFALIPKTDQKL